MKKLWHSLVGLFTVICPHCGKRLARGWAEVYDDPGEPILCQCYKCGKHFHDGIF